MVSKTSFIKYKLKNEATSNIKIQQIRSSLFLNDVKTYLGDGSLNSGKRLVNLHPTKGRHWVVYINEN